MLFPMAQPTLEADLSRHAREDRVTIEGLWSPRRRALTLGLVLTITLVAFEALAIATIMPVVARDLGSIQL